MHKNLITIKGQIVFDARNVSNKKESRFTGSSDLFSHIKSVVKLTSKIFVL